MSLTVSGKVALLFAKTSAPDTAQAILAGIEPGTGDIYHDPIGVNLGGVDLTNPKSPKRQVAEMGPT